jgi:phage terminase small subunit
VPTSRPKPKSEKKTNPYALSDRQWLFAQEYAACGVGAEAAVKAGYSRKCAKQAAARLLTNIDLARAVTDLRKERDLRTKITVDVVVQETWANYRRCVDAGKFSAANKALELLGRHVGAFPNKHEHSGPDGDPVPITIIRFHGAESREA